jgi:hypothetical protein
MQIAEPTGQKKAQKGRQIGALPVTQMAGNVRVNAKKRPRKIDKT